MVPLFATIFEMAYTILELYKWVLIAAAVLSWLVAFNVINTNNRAIAMIGDALYRITEPALRPIRRLLPNLGGIDISPVIAILVIIFLQSLIGRYAAYLLHGDRAF